MTPFHSCGAPIADAGARFCGGCGRRLDSTDPDLPFALGSEIQGRYRIIAVLGRGGMGTVFKAHDIKMRRDVALKALSPELVAHRDARRRMHREAKALTGIEHENVVRIFDYFDEGAIFVIVLELVSGGTASDLSGKIGGNEAVGIMLDVLRGLEAIHASPDGLVHRDIKPDNILITSGGRAKVTDFGVARDESSQDKTRLGARIGTVPYMSPEQTQGLTIDPRSDLFSASIVFFELLSGEKPFSGPSELEVGRRIVHEPPDWELIRGRALDSVCAVIAQGLSKNPDDRFQSAREMREALERPELPAPTSPPQKLAPSVPPGEWSVSGRLGRMGYFKRMMLAILGFLAAFSVGAALEATSTGAAVLTPILVFVPFVWVFVFTTRRLHDFGVSGWIQAAVYASTFVAARVSETSESLELLPNILAILWLCLLLFAPSERTANKYGPPPS